MSAEEPVTSPDQHKPGHPKAARAGAIVVALCLLAMITTVHHGHVEDVFLILTAAALIGTIVADWLLRKNGLKH